MRLSALGLIGGALLASAVNVASVSAQTPASISGSATLITPSGFTSTVSGESVLPSGFIFDTAPGVLVPATPPGPTNPGVPGIAATLADAQVFVVPAYEQIPYSVAVSSLSVGSSVAPTQPVTDYAPSFTAAAAVILTDSAVPGFPGALNIDFISAIIKAGAGVNGLD